MTLRADAFTGSPEMSGCWGEYLTDYAATVQDHLRWDAAWQPLMHAGLPR